jgi:uncharacterized protein YbjT (DUF2867 family)
MEILVTGGTGTLGKALLPLLVAEGHAVRVLTRRRDPLLPSGVRAVQGDLRTGAGLGVAVGGVERIVHAASSPVLRTRSTDVEGTRRLLEAARAAGAPLVVYTSIVGVDRHPFPYYQAKRDAEALVESSGLPFLIVRGTQFHQLLLRGLRPLACLPVVPLPRGFRFQPIDAAEYAGRLVAALRDGERGRAPDIGGPEILTIDEIARSYLEARGARRPCILLPLPGRSARAFRAGLNLCPGRAVGKLTWKQFLAGADVTG